jgi:hypothetical protein
MRASRIGRYVSEASSTPIVASGTDCSEFKPTRFGRPVEILPLEAIPERRDFGLIAGT